MKLNFVAVAVLCGGLSCTTAMASNLVWTFSGPITLMAETAGNPLTGGATDWSLEVTIDTLAPDLEPSDPVLGRYATTSVLTLGTLTQAFTSEMLVYNDLSGVADALQFNDTAPVPSGWSQFLVQITLQTTVTLTALTSDAIPSSPPNLADFRPHPNFA